jgi:hypothetical protein
MAGKTGSSPSFVQEEGITFQIPLSAPPTIHYIPPSTPGTAQCPGSFTNPTAARGELCLYADTQFQSDGVSVVSGTPNRFGVVVFPSGVAPGKNYELDGTWAVTAP